jgi:hypothetical protein
MRMSARVGFSHSANLQVFLAGAAEPNCLKPNDPHSRSSRMRGCQNWQFQGEGTSTGQNSAACRKSMNAESSPKNKVPVVVHCHDKLLEDIF